MRSICSTTICLIGLLISISALFVVIADFVCSNPNNGLDVWITRIIQYHHSPFKDAVMSSVSFNGKNFPFIVLIGLTALAYYLGRYKLEAVLVLCTLLGGVVAAIIKSMIDRPRPSGLWVRIVEAESSSSYPSSTVVMAVLFFGFNVFLTCYLRDIGHLTRKMIWSVGFFMVLAVPVSRIYLGAHWFTDVVAGVLLGSFLLILLCFVYHKKRLQHPSIIGEHLL